MVEFLSKILNREQKKFKSPLFFIAVLPDRKLSDEVTNIKKYFADRYDSHHALRSPPHITLHMPFRWREDRESSLFKVLANFASKQRKFNIDLEDFGSFPPRVIFIKVKNAESLSNLKSGMTIVAKLELKLLNADYKDQPFHPHMTVAFRDLKRPAFKEAWKEFSQKKIYHRFKVERLTLLRHNGKFWEIHREFDFQLD